MNYSRNQQTFVEMKWNSSKKHFSSLQIRVNRRPTLITFSNIYQLGSSMLITIFLIWQKNCLWFLLKTFVEISSFSIKSRHNKIILLISNIGTSYVLIRFFWTEKFKIWIDTCIIFFIRMTVDCMSKQCVVQSTINKKKFFLYYYYYSFINKEIM